jgi:peptidoglycan DL-endopeptidase CwlO
LGVGLLVLGVYGRGVTLDLVVARVGAALGRGHALFSPAPLDAGAALGSSADTLESLSGRVGETTQAMDARGKFGATYRDVAQGLSGRLAAAGGQDRVLGGLASDAAESDGQGRAQSGNVVNAAADDTARTGPYANTPAGQQALLAALRERVDEQRQVIAAYKARDAKLAALARAQAYRQQYPGGGQGMGSMLSGLGGGMNRGGAGPGLGGLGGLSAPNLAGLFKPATNTTSASTGIAQLGVADDPDSGLGAPAARAALSIWAHRMCGVLRGPVFLTVRG